MKEKRELESSFWEKVIGRRIGDASEKKRLGIRIKFGDMEFGRKCRKWEACIWSLEKHDM